MKKIINYLKIDFNIDINNNIKIVDDIINKNINTFSLSYNENKYTNDKYILEYYNNEILQYLNEKLPKNLAQSIEIFKNTIFLNYWEIFNIFQILNIDIINIFIKDENFNIPSLQTLFIYNKINQKLNKIIVYLDNNFSVGLKNIDLKIINKNLNNKNHLEYDLIIYDINENDENVIFIINLFMIYKMLNIKGNLIFKIENINNFLIYYILSILNKLFKHVYVYKPLINLSKYYYIICISKEKITNDKLSNFQHLNQISTQNISKKIIILQNNILINKNFINYINFNNVVLFNINNILKLNNNDSIITFQNNMKKIETKFLKYFFPKSTNSHDSEIIIFSD